MLHALPVVNINPQEVCMYRAVLVAGFYGLIHPGELTACPFGVGHTTPIT